jgi:hypothetical protein
VFLARPSPAAGAAMTKRRWTIRIHKDGSLCAFDSFRECGDKESKIVTVEEVETPKPEEVWLHRRTPEAAWWFCVGVENACRYHEHKLFREVVE